MAHEQPVLLADGGWPDGVVVDLDVAVLEVGGQLPPVAQRVVAGLAQFALGQASVSQDRQYAFDSGVGIGGLLLSQGLCLGGRKGSLADLGLHLV